MTRVQLVALVIGTVLISAAGAVGVARTWVAPDICESQLNAEVDAMLASPMPMEDWQADSSGLWGCGFLTENKRREVGSRVMQIRGPEIMAKAFDQAFNK
jgi:hypothetical protein